jgi:hypothetical protein
MVWGIVILLQEPNAMTVGASVVSTGFGLKASISNDSLWSAEAVDTFAFLSVSSGGLAPGFVFGFTGVCPVCAMAGKASITAQSAVKSRFDFIIEQVWNNSTAVGIIKNDFSANIVQSATLRFVNFKKISCKAVINTLYSAICLNFFFKTTLGAVPSSF